MNIEMENDDEAGLLLLVQQYASKFGIGFDSSLMDDPDTRKKLAQLMVEAISGKRGAITDEDVLGS